MKFLRVRKDSYHDSVFLMLATQELKASGGVREAVVAMGTDMNRDLLSGMGFGGPDLDGAGPNDLLVAVEAQDAAKAEAALDRALELVDRKKASSASGLGGSGLTRTGSLDAALSRLPKANLAVISLPGAYAAREARKALEKGLHVMLFSDNVSLEEEVDLKRRAAAKGLLVMGPDCGTAIVNGQPLCFANVVRSGGVGVAAASGTGLQEVTCLVDRYGAGISQAVGTGGRDLKNPEVGGRTMLLTIAALAADPATSVIVVISKPPAPETAKAVMDALARSGKPCVVHFLGLSDPSVLGKPAADIQIASDLEDCARRAAALSLGRAYKPVDWDLPESEISQIIDRESAGFSPSQKHLRGLYTGGTLADEALFLLQPLLGPIWSNNQTNPALVPPDPQVSREHTIVDLGDDVFTVGRPHPMIDPSTRTDRLDAEAEDPSVAVLLLDLVLGYGSHPDPAGALVPHIQAAREKAAARGGRLSVVASVTGTPSDFQGFEEQKRKLQAAGVVVMPSNSQAARLSARILQKGAAR